jgi:hypothetical protein
VNVELYVSGDDGLFAICTPLSFNTMLLIPHHESDAVTVMKTGLVVVGVVDEHDADEITEDSLSILTSTGAEAAVTPAMFFAAAHSQPCVVAVYVFGKS